MIRTFLAVLLLASVIGCKGGRLSPEERAKQSNEELAKHKDSIVAKVNAIQALAKIELPAPEEKLNAPGLNLMHPSISKGAVGKNVVLVPVEQLPDLSAKLNLPMLYMDVDAEDPPRWAKGLAKVDEVHPNAVRDFIAGFEGLQFVLVVKQTHLESPTLRTDEFGKKVFTPGQFTGEAHLLGVDGKRYGGITWKATNSTSVTTHTKNEDQAWLEGDLKTNVERALFEELKKQLPGSVLE